MNDTFGATDEYEILLKPSFFYTFFARWVIFSQKL